MRVLHAETGRHLYGGARQVVLLMEGLEARGVENILLCGKGSALARAVRTRARILAPPLAGALDPRLPLHLALALRRFRPDLIHVHSRRGVDYWAGLVAALSGTPAVITRRVDNPETARLARAKYRCYDRVIAVSQGVREVLAAQGLSAHNVVCVPDGVDPSPAGRSCERPWFLCEFDLDASHRVIATIAQLIPRKGHRVILEALPEVIREFPDLRVLLFGQGALRGELEQICRRYGLLSHVRFAGFRTDLHRILPCLDLVVHPALMEGLGLSLLEAAAAGVPVVASRVGGIPEVVRDGVNGLLVPPADAQALAAAIIRVLREPVLARALGTAGPELVRQNFSAARMVDGNLSVYREVLAGGPKRARDQSCRWVHP
ncbi:MAG TPA: glycosyltransferase family 4 protein [Syntrophobacteria bacterium]|nr:glycosyltransferase family 4 protein [Syntrophobacteria bacterium]